MVNCRKNSPSVATFTAPAVTASAITMAATMAAPRRTRGIRFLCFISCIF